MLVRVLVPAALVGVVWLLLLVSVLQDSGGSASEPVSIRATTDTRAGGVRGFFSGIGGGISSAIGEGATPPKLSALPYAERGSSHQVFYDSPPSLKEIERNISTYLTTLHKHLGALAGPKASALRIWETFLEVTSRTLISWDEQNRNRFPKPRKDGSIFVSVGTYRDEYCPMTLKSLYAEAQYPEKVFVGLFQQNCFEKTCRTGVLASGAVEDTGTDVNCYDEFCKSAEGVRSGACTNHQVRLFNVNESESLGPYMARYFGAKFYRGEEFYLQIDSHSEFVSHWDTKLIDMIHNAPADKPVISTYPPAPDALGKWKDSVGFKICDSTFASSQIEWQIVRLEPSQPMVGRPTVPVYAPFVAAGFFFSRGQFLNEVSKHCVLLNPLYLILFLLGPF